MPLSNEVQTQIAKRFADEPDREAVRALLAEFESERLCISILRLARGKVERVKRLAEDARRDYRDVIAWASQPIRTYIVGLLRKGPNWTPDDDKRATSLKFDVLRRWKTAGAVVVGGRFVDFGDARGMYLFTVDSVEEAETLAGEDPGVQSGKLAFEFHPWVAPDGIRVASPDEL